MYALDVTGGQPYFAGFHTNLVKIWHFMHNHLPCTIVKVCVSSPEVQCVWLEWVLACDTNHRHLGGGVVKEGNGKALLGV